MSSYCMNVRCYTIINFERTAIFRQARMKFVLAFSVLIVAYCALPVSSEGLQEKRLWKAIGGFGHSLLREVLGRQKHKENVLLSPLSVHSALSMIVFAALDKTKSELVRTIRTGNNVEELANAYSTFTSRQYENTTRADLQLTLRLANRMYVRKSSPLDPTYVDQLESTFNGNAVNVDFARNEVIKNEINDFVEQKTDGLIHEILKKPLDKDTAMVLVNALYFKGYWEYQMQDMVETLKFNEGCLRLEQQHRKWLTFIGRLPYIDSDQLHAKVLLIPYMSSQFSASMLIVMPREEYQCNIKNWLKYHEWESLMHIIDFMLVRNVNLTLPRFEIDYRAMLRDALQRMGMERSFSSSKANLSTLLTTSDEQFQIDQVVHGAKIIVTKFGTETAAASASVTRPKPTASPREPSIKLSVNKSFYVAVLYGKFRAEQILPLFTGVVINV
ncbi:serpin B9-like [Tropilaelaps mercedesae]|uniref:Serpin B9-like n=1 Tax=Tropilaelaps mercedesae TaxID=418985 RepID=A0A1V9XJ81_9ACAR|nr:serpin B9-like [Tropilaelaps mercedesae]